MSNVILQDVYARLDSRIRSIADNSYDSMSKRVWWENVAAIRNSESRSERIDWLLSTAQIERPNASHGGGQQIFDSMVSTYTEFEVENAVAALELKREIMLDLYNGLAGGEAMNLASKWAKDIGKHSAYWPQQVIAEAIKANPVGYDTKAFFAVDHPYNPYNTGAGIYANRFTGSASGANPGALPIGGADLTVALTNLGKAVAVVEGIKTANGKLPRNLTAAKLLVPPALHLRALQLTSASFLSGASSGPNDVAPITRTIGLEVIKCPELGAGFTGGSDSTYYIVAEEVAGDELGAFLYVLREPFEIVANDANTDAGLARKRSYQWTLEGRNSVAPGHPYLMYRIDAA